VFCPLGHRLSPLHPYVQFPEQHLNTRTGDRPPAPFASPLSSRPPTGSACFVPKSRRQFRSFYSIPPSPKPSCSLFPPLTLGALRAVTLPTSLPGLAAECHRRRDPFASRPHLLFFLRHPVPVEPNHKVKPADYDAPTSVSAVSPLPFSRLWITPSNHNYQQTHSRERSSPRDHLTDPLSAVFSSPKIFLMVHQGFPP